MAKANFNHVEIKPTKNSRLIALEIWILIFYKYKKLDDIINNSNDESLKDPETIKSKEILFKERGGPKGPEPTRYGDWEKSGRCSDF